MDSLCTAFSDLLQYPDVPDKHLEDDEISYMAPFPTRGPSIYEEVHDMLASNKLLYPLSQWTTATDSQLQLPQRHETIYNVVHSHKCFDAAAAANFARLGHREMVALDDEHADLELVYMVELDHDQRRIILTFRGSVTRRDWVTDLDIGMRTVPHTSMRVHAGFYRYLFEPTPRGPTAPDGTHLSEYQKIIQEHLRPPLCQHPDYELYITGHSLGAALATIFAVQAASDGLAQVVNLVSLASPYCGDAGFRQRHLALERTGRLRHLRVSNYQDPVTLVPKISMSWQIFQESPGALFKHVGMNLRLFEEDRFQISFPKVRTGVWSALWEETQRGWDQSIFTNWTWNPTKVWPHHSLREYEDRLEAQKEELQYTYLNDLYSQPRTVGQLVAQF